MMIPCKCGHERDDHFKIEFYGGKETELPCRNIGYCWCGNYRPIPNLQYLEKLHKENLKK